MNREEGSQEKDGIRRRQERCDACHTMAISSLDGSSSEEERRFRPMDDTSMHSRARASHFFP